MTRPAKKWKRIRGGLHRCYRGDELLAEIERGAETGKWYATDTAGPVGRFKTLKEAKKETNRWV